MYLAVRGRVVTGDFDLVTSPHEVLVNVGTPTKPAFLAERLLPPSWSHKDAGAQVVDWDGDGLLDVVTCSGRPKKSKGHAMFRFYKNVGGKDRAGTAPHLSVR